MYTINPNTPSTDSIWPLAAQILEIEQRKEAASPIHEFIFRSGYEAGMRLIWKDAHQSVFDEAMEEPEFLALLGHSMESDPLQADREIVRNELFGQGLDRALIDAYATGDLINALKRLAGLGVGNG